jgi:hypothetical protein
MSPLTGDQQRLLCDAVLDAFASADLTRLLKFDLDVELDKIVRVEAFESTVFQLINWLEARGRTQEFLDAMAKARPKNQKVQQTVAVLGGTPAPESPLAKPVAAVNSLGAVLSIVDQIYPQLTSFSTNQPVPVTEQQPRLLSRTERNEIRFVEGQKALATRITYEDIDRLLSKDNQVLLKTFEERMQDNFKSWNELYRKSGASTSKRQNAKVDAQLDELARELCSDLKHIFGYLKTLKYELQDHFKDMFYICDHFGK